VWWAGTAALVHQAWRFVSHRDWRSGAVLVGFLAGWVPWLMFQGRTIFTFYAIAFLPFLVMALAMSLGTVLGPANASPNRRMWGAIAAGSVVLAAVALCWFFYPIWTGETIPYDMWQKRMWFPSWI
jgi:dolichyl-phosphate-mannose--protein O-mannosyl transferase